jgi:hypothetical protein
MYRKFDATENLFFYSAFFFKLNTASQILVFKTLTRRTRGAGYVPTVHTLIFFLVSFFFFVRGTGEGVSSLSACHCSMGRRGVSVSPVA